MMRGLPSRRNPALASALVLPADGPATPRPPAAPRNHGAWPSVPSTPHSPCHPSATRTRCPSASHTAAPTQLPVASPSGHFTSGDLCMKCATLSASYTQTYDCWRRSHDSAATMFCLAVGSPMLSPETTSFAQHRSKHLTASLRHRPRRILAIAIWTHLFSQSPRVSTSSANVRGSVHKPGETYMAHATATRNIPWPTVSTPTPFGRLLRRCIPDFRFTPIPGERRARAVRALPRRRAWRPETHTARRRNPRGCEACPSPTKRIVRSTSKKATSTTSVVCFSAAMLPLGAPLTRKHLSCVRPSHVRAAAL